jgi:hypothetical protein
VSRPVVTVVVRAELGVDLIRVLRGWLKVGLRNFGLRCVTIYPQQEDDMYDFSAAERQGGTIPEGVYALEAKVQPGGHGEGDLLHHSSKGTLEMLKLQLKVTTGEYAGRTFFEYINLDVIEGKTRDQEQINKCKTAVRLGRIRMRAIIESARNIPSDDDSNEANQRRRVDSLKDLDGFVFLAQVDVREQNGYRPKNTIGYIITPDMPEWQDGVTSANGGSTSGLPKRSDDPTDEIPF